MLFSLSRPGALTEILDGVLLIFFIRLVVLRTTFTVVKGVSLAEKWAVRRVFARRISCAVIIGVAILAFRTFVLIGLFVTIIGIVAIALTGVAVTIVAIVPSFIVLIDSSTFMVLVLFALEEPAWLRKDSNALCTF